LPISYGMMPSPNLMAAALARRSTEAMLLVLGNSIALYNPPVRVAEEMAMLDVMSGGRLIAGFPVGTSMDINYCYGQNPATVRDKYREGHDLIMKAWASREPFPWNGKYTKLRYVNLWPQPIQKPHPPIWIPGLGSIETWDWCVDHAYNYSYLSFSGYKRARKMLVDERYIVAGSPATVRQQLEELARSLRVGHLLLGLHIGSSPIELTNRSTYLCATEVLAHLRPLWGEYEDHWWPKALPAAER